MRKKLRGVLALLLCFSLLGCSNSNQAKKSESTKETTNKPQNALNLTKEEYDEFSLEYSLYSSKIEDCEKEMLKSVEKGEEALKKINITKDNFDQSDKQMWSFYQEFMSVRIDMNKNFNNNYDKYNTERLKKELNISDDRKILIAKTLANAIYDYVSTNNKLFDTINFDMKKNSNKDGKKSEALLTIIVKKNIFKH